MSKYDPNSPKAILGRAGHQAVVDAIRQTDPNLEVYSTREELARALKFPDDSYVLLNFLEKVTGDIGVCFSGKKPQLVEICTTESMDDNIGLGKSKVECCRADWFAFVRFVQSQPEIRMIKRHSFDLYAKEKLADKGWVNPVGVGREKLLFVPFNFRSSYSVDDFVKTRGNGSG